MSGPNNGENLEIEIASSAEKQPQDKISSVDSIQLLMRMLVGMAALGGEGLSRVLQDAQEEVELSGGKPRTGDEIVAEEDIDQLKYLLMGSLVQAQKSARKGVQRGLRFSLRTSGAMLGAFYAITDNRLLRRVRKPVDMALSNIVRETDKAVRVGRIEDQQSRELAQQAIDEMVDAVVDMIATNPKVTQAIQEIVGSQGLGMTGMMMDGVSERTANADNVLENVVRRLLRMTPRDELPSSPIYGEPQFMYLPDDYTPDTDKD